MSKTETFRQSINAGPVKNTELLELIQRQEQRLAQIEQLMEQNQAQILQFLAQPAPQHVEATVTIPPEILVSLETASTLLSNASEQMPVLAKKVLSETIQRDHEATAKALEAANEMSIAATKTSSAADEIKQQAKESHDERMGLGSLLIVAIVAAAFATTVTGLGVTIWVKDRLVEDTAKGILYHIQLQQKQQQRSPATLRSR